MMTMIFDAEPKEIADRLGLDYNIAMSTIVGDDYESIPLSLFSSKASANGYVVDESLEFLEMMENLFEQFKTKHDE